MPKAKKTKYYAVRIGHGGPNIYRNWEDCKAKVSRYPGAVHKSFLSLQEAERWLASTLDLDSTSCFNSSSHTATSEPKPPQFNPSQTEGQHDPFVQQEEFILLEPLHKPTVVLSKEQHEILKKVKYGENVFFTGSAGTGKSVLLREIIQLCGGSTSSSLAITASTGIAAVNIGGVTLHSWAGIGLGLEKAEKLAGKMLGQKTMRDIVHRWRNVKTLIIDEVSMIDGTLFDKLEYIARCLRDVNAPFGGIQLILSGDFCQLPPVGARDQNGLLIPPVFAFDAETWNSCMGSHMSLTRVFRQKDQKFIDMLNSMRFGNLEQATIDAFKALSREIVYTDGIQPTELFPTRAEVENSNQSRLRQLPGLVYTYNANDHGGIDSRGQGISPQQTERLLERLIAPKAIHLKVGAQVMLIKNLIQGVLVNGSVGQVLRFISPAEAVKEHVKIAKPEGQDSLSKELAFFSDSLTWPVVKFINGKEVMIIPQEFTINNAEGEMEARRIQIPLILAYALSVHKSQGQTLERVKVDLRRTFEKGQAYVALSRATSMEGLQVIGFDATKVIAHPRVLAWHGQNNDCNIEEDMDNEEDMTAYYMT